MTAFLDRPDGARLAYEVHGAGGVTLLLVHGTTADRHRWEPIRPYFADRTTVVLDRRGRGESTDGSAAYDMRLEFDDVAALVRVLADRSGAPVDVFGHSYGARCAIGAAAQGAPVRRLVLYEPPAASAVPAEQAADIEALLAAGRDDEALGYFLVRVVGRRADEIPAMRSTPMWSRRLRALRTLPREVRAVREVDPSALTAAVHQPALLVLGLISPSWARIELESVAAALRDARWLRLPDQGHMAIDLAPQALAAGVRDFLDEA